MKSFFRSFSLILGLVFLSMVVSSSVQLVNARDPGPPQDICFNDLACTQRSNPVTRLPAACATLPDPCTDPGCACRQVV